MSKHTRRRSSATASRSRSSSSAVRSPWFSSASVTPSSAAAAHARAAGRDARPAAERPRWAGPPATIRISGRPRRGGVREPGEQIVHRLGPVAERETLGRAPGEPERQAVGLGDGLVGLEKRRRAQKGRSAAARSRARVQCVRNDVERAAREAMRADCSPRPHLAEQAMVGIAVDADTRGRVRDRARPGSISRLVAFRNRSRKAIR